MVFSPQKQDQKLFHRQIRPSSHKRKNCSVESHITVIRHGSADFDEAKDSALLSSRDAGLLEPPLSGLKGVQPPLPFGETGLGGAVYHPDVSLKTLNGLWGPNTSPTCLHPGDRFPEPS